MRPRAAGSRLAPGLEVVAHLRRGNDLDVYDAWSDELGARCVVKTLRPDRRGSRSAGSRLLREGRLLQRLSHPHMVRAHAVLREPWPAVVLEVLGGETLGHRLDRERLAPREAAILGLHVGSALRYLHHHGIVHLDVKPSNIILDAARARLLDLSVARPPGPLAKAGVGTPGYLAPEQARGGVVGPAADIWGLGITLLEALVDEDGLPDGRRDGVVLPPRLRHLRPRAPRALDELLAACLALDPAERPPLQTVLGRLEPLAGVPPEQRRFDRRLTRATGVPRAPC